MNRTMVLVGTYAQPIMFGTGEMLNAKGKGIYLYELKDGRFSLIFQTEATNASFLIVNRERTNLY